MNKILIFIFLNLFSLHLLASKETKNVVLLTSFSKKEAKLEPRIEKIFKKKLRGLALSLKVIHKADQELLHGELINKNNFAVFWISHGAFIQNKVTKSTGIAAQNMILDYNRDNVAHVFQKVHPNINFLGIIGCSTKQILETYKSDNIWSPIDDIPASQYISKSKTIAQFGLRRAIRRFKKALRRNQLEIEKLDFVRTGQSITITRKIPSHIPENEIRSLKLIHEGNFIGILNRSKPGEWHRQTFVVPYFNSLKRSKIALTLESGENVNKDQSKIHFGEIIISAKNHPQWHLFSKKSGEPFGINKRVFLTN